MSVNRKTDYPMKPILCILTLACSLLSLNAQPHQTPTPTPTDSVARTYAIDDVVVVSKTRQKRLGRSVRSSFFSYGGSQFKQGQELGVACHAGKRTLRLGMLRIYCSTRQFDTLVFRLRLYKMDGEVVGEQIPTPSIHIPFNNNMKYIAADLTPYDLNICGDFLLSIEYAFGRTNGTHPAIFHNGRIGARTDYRDTQNPTWSVEGIGIGLSVDATPVAQKNTTPTSNF